MKPFINALLISIALLSHGVAMACSFGPRYETINPADVDWIRQDPGDPPPPPSAYAKLERGFDDGEPGSCSDAGVLTIVLENEPSEDIAGFSFTLNGDFPSNVVPDRYILPTERRGELVFLFVWLDLPRYNLSGAIEMRQVNKFGTLGEPRVFRLDGQSD